jgi:Ion transport protein
MNGQYGGGGGPELQRFAVLRLFRLLRLMRAFQSSNLVKVSIEAMFMAIRRSFETLLVVLVVLVMVVIVFSTLIYSVERGEWDPVRKIFIGQDGQPSHFDSIPATFWFVLEIITTVGLGDVYPKTVAGRMITFPVMLFGLLIVALPSIVIGRNFADAWTLLRVNKIGRRHSAGLSPVYQLDKATTTTTACVPLEDDFANNSGPPKRAMATCGPQDLLEELLKDIGKQNALLERLLQSQKSQL